MEVMDYSIESNRLRAKSICNMVDDYGLVINEEHSEFYNSCREIVADLEKNEEGKKVVEELLNRGEFKKELEEDELYKADYGDDEVFKYTKTVENTSGIRFKYITYTIKGTLANGEVENAHSQLIEFSDGKVEEIKIVSNNNYESIEVIVEMITLY